MSTASERKSGAALLLFLVCSFLLSPVATARLDAAELRTVDVVQMVLEQHRSGKTGLAKKTRSVDARPAKIGEVVVTVISGEGKETESPPASAGDMVVQNRCAETGNERILVRAAKFAERYEGPLGPGSQPGWHTYRPRGKIMRYFIIPRAIGSVQFKAPWGELMKAHPGDALVQDPDDGSDSYRIAARAFVCTYEIVRPAKP